MGAHESSLISLLQTETGPSPFSRSPSSPPYFGHFVVPAAAVGLGASAGGRPEPWHATSSEMLLGAPPQIGVRPDLAVQPGAGVVGAVGPAPPADSAALAAEVEPRRELRLGLGPQLGAHVYGAGPRIWL